MENSNQSVDWSKVFWNVGVVLILTLLYAVIRYSVVRDTPITNIPIYISNKAVALSATILIGLSYALGPLTRIAPKTFSENIKLRKQYGIGGFMLATMHAIMSLAIFNPAYFPRLFEQSGKLNGIGESMLLMGILSLLIFGSISVTGIPSVGSSMDGKAWQSIQRLGYIAYFFLLVHVFVIGYRGWLRPESWEFGMASISLIAAMVIVLVFLLRIFVSALPPALPQQKS